MARSTFLYVSYIRTTPDKLWTALTDAEFMKRYWFGMHCESQWRPGSSWQLLSQSGEVWDAGEIVEADRPRRLVIRWSHVKRPELKAEGPSLCVMEIEALGEACKLTITHSIEREGSMLVEAVSGGWPKIVSNLKSLLETGQVAFESAPAQAQAAAQ
ncbi:MULTISPECIES: SRPBCC family protein [Ramlibacter]|uniref:SRPBCC family protein n=1 Tax=Ramlibacter aquaticus TaxID=2780094 RepID=A0ABR9SA88_9BURK|nr:MULTISPECIES: SRPBCC family protein [Ramlibacter]MBE7939253.1 SRPBCC family protein [Ramlibacter aquaticus]